MPCCVVLYCSGVVRKRNHSADITTMQVGASQALCGCLLGLMQRGQRGQQRHRTTAEGIKDGQSVDSGRILKCG
jgi:hypothetical protein